MQIMFGATGTYGFAVPATFGGGAGGAGPAAVNAPVNGAPNGAATTSGFASPYQLFGNPYQNAGSSQAPAAGTGHTTVNSTNALATAAAPAAGQGVNGQSGFQGGFAGLQSGFAGGGYLVPAFAAPVFVPGFFVFAVPMAQAAPMQAPMQSPSVPAPVAAPTPAVPPAIETPVGQTPVAETPVAETPAAETPSVPSTGGPTVEVSADNLRTRLIDRSTDVSFSLSLTTREGDQVEISFAQQSTRNERALRDADTQQRVSVDRTGDDQRQFDLDIIGELSAAERTAIDAMMDEVLQVADAFFRGNDAEVLSSLGGLALDGETLTELSLSLSVSQTVNRQQGYGEDPVAFQQLREGNGERMKMLDFLATEQRRMIDQAQEVLDDPSAVRFVQGSLSGVLNGVLNALTDQLDDAFAVAPESSAQQTALAQGSVASRELAQEPVRVPLAQGQLATGDEATPISDQVAPGPETAGGDDAAVSARLIDRSA